MSERLSKVSLQNTTRLSTTIKRQRFFGVDPERSNAFEIVREPHRPVRFFALDISEVQLDQADVERRFVSSRLFVGCVVDMEGDVCSRRARVENSWKGKSEATKEKSFNVHIVPFFSFSRETKEMPACSSLHHVKIFVTFSSSPLFLLADGRGFPVRCSATRICLRRFVKAEDRNKRSAQQSFSARRRYR